ncbi:hypothetical protein [Flavobacterium sp. GSA192]|uniref:hypothetical protein n=1 Tax=Flavobacterium sp. GSA192 TaxID=2576304 RepID=UPI001129873B|nr:hypothetical protein [Flavobacterium sp. GSA192]
MENNTISKFFDVLTRKLATCLLTKNSILKFFNVDYLSRFWQAMWHQSVVRSMLLFVILMMAYTVNAQNIKGIVPVQYPISGSGVDGDAWAHEPINTIYQNVGDLFDRQFGNPDYPLDITNNGVLDFSNGSLLYPGFTFFLQDRYVDDLTIFTSSNKINDNPNTYTWGAGSSPNKNEIQNAGAHFSYGSASVEGGESIDGLTFVNGTNRFGNPTDLWCLFAGDRQVTNGSSYIDFEFLQKPLTITGATFGPVDPNTGIAPITGGSGAFSTLGTQGGRTVGDVLITIEFTQGGGDATVVIRVWKAVGSGFEYVVVPNTTFPGNVFCTNNSVTTTVPFDAYGVTPGTYAPNQWAEGAINLTEVFKNTSPNDPCFNISTLFIRTRSSGNSAQSELKDFPGAPIQLNLNLIPIANAGADFAMTCITNPNGKEIGEAPEAGFTYSWSPTTGLSDPNIANPIANPLVSTTYTVTKTKTGTVCSATDSVDVTVNKPTVVAVAGDDFTKTCTTNANGGTIGEASAAGYTYSWSSMPAGFSSSLSNPSVNPSVTTTYTVTKTHTASGCSDTDEVTVTVDKPDVLANAGTDFTISCIANTSGGSIGEASAAGYTYSWTSIPAGFSSSLANPSVNPSVTTTYTVTKTHTASGCSDTDEVTVTVNKPTVVAVAGDDFTKTCTTNANGGTIGEASAAGYTYSWTSMPAGFSSSLSNPSVNPSVTTTYTVTKTHTASGCSDTDEVTVTVNKPDVLANAGTDFTISCIANTSGGSIGEASAAGYTYSWTSIPAGFSSSLANPSVNPSVTTTYTVTKTHTASGCSDTDEVTVTVNKELPNANAGSDGLILCGTSSVMLLGSSTTQGATFAWVASNGGNIVSGVDTATPTVNAAGTYTLTVTNPANGCTSTDAAMVSVQICSDALCTYTQGYYGNIGGMSCAPDGLGGFASYTTKALIEKALASYGGAMYVGIKDVRHVSIMNNMTDIDAIIAVLPGGGMSKALPTGPNNGLHSISNLPQSLLKDGNINNTLLAQTIVLGLNLGINGQLGDFELQAGTFATAASEGGCGSDTPKIRSCNPDGTTNNEYEFYSIPANIVTALGGNATVQGLYALANQALGGGDTNGVSLSAIADVVDKINNAFDECRIPVGYGIEPLDCPVIETITTMSLMQADLAGFVAYPVPVDGQLSIQCTFDYTSDATIEVFDSKNQMVYTKSQAQCSNGTVITLDYNFNSEQQQVFYIRLTTSQGSTTHDVISAAK